MIAQSPQLDEPQRDWSFARKPKWLASHLFVLSLLTLFLIAGFWQLARHGDRVEVNKIIDTRAVGQPVDFAVAAVLDLDQLEYQRVAVSGEWTNTDLVRVNNRSQNGLAGEWVVGMFRSDTGASLLINRGFTPVNQEIALDDPPPGALVGWLRNSQTKDGFFGAVDPGPPFAAPRLDVELLGMRDTSVDPFPMWLQLETPAPVGVPEPVQLPDRSNGAHLGYAAQWFGFIPLSVAFYYATLRRLAGRNGALGSSLIN